MPILSKASILAATLVLALNTAACVTTSVVPLSAAGQHQPIPVDFVQVFATESDVPGPYDKIAIIHARGASDWTNETMMFNKLKQDAAELGANGIVVGSVEEPSAGAKVAGAIFGVSSERKGQVLAVRYRPDPVYSIEEEVRIDSTFLVLESNVIGTPDYNRGQLQVRPGKIITEDTTAYVLYVDWVGLSTVALSDTTLVRFGVDGSRFALTAERYWQQQNCDERRAVCANAQSARFPISIERLNQIANGERVVVAVDGMGQDSGLEQTFSSRNRAVIQQFIAEHIEEQE